MMAVRIPPMPEMTAMMALPMVRKRDWTQETTAPILAVVVVVDGEVCGLEFVVKCGMEQSMICSVDAVDMLLPVWTLESCDLETVSTREG
jgi:hypothetical protein